MQTETENQITKAELAIQRDIYRSIAALEFIHANRSTLESLNLPISIFGNYVDFDNLQRPALLAVIKAFPGHWEKTPTYDNSGISYTLDTRVSGRIIRCYNGEAPPSCVIEETVEYREVPARTERVVTRKIKCPTNGEAVS